MTFSDESKTTAGEIGALLPVVIMALQMIKRLSRTAFHASRTDWIETTMLLQVASAPERQVRVGELASRLSVSKSLVSERAGRLFMMGLISYKDDPQDRRNVFLVLTEHGEETVAGLIEALKDELTAAFGYMQPEEAVSDYSQAFLETPYTKTALQLAEESSDSAVAWILTQYHDIRSAIDKQLAIVPGLTENAFLVLVELMLSEKKLTLNAISEHLLLSKTEIFRTQSYLLANDYVERERTPEDRRVVQIGLTERGATLLRAVLPVIYEGLEGVLPPMSDKAMEAFSYYASVYNSRFGVRE